MTDPIVCIKCGATSYNDPGKTPVCCNRCWTKQEEQLVSLRAENERLKGLLETAHDDLQEAIDYLPGEGRPEAVRLCQTIQAALSEKREKK
jgi:hypothetical protein